MILPISPHRPIHRTRCARSRVRASAPSCRPAWHSCRRPFTRPRVRATAADLNFPSKPLIPYFFYPRFTRPFMKFSRTNLRTNTTVQCYSQDLDHPSARLHADQKPHPTLGSSRGRRADATTSSTSNDVKNSSTAGMAHHAVHRFAVLSALLTRPDPSIGLRPYTVQAMNCNIRS